MKLRLDITDAGAFMLGFIFVLALLFSQRQRRQPPSPAKAGTAPEVPHSARVDDIGEYMERAHSA